MTSILWTFQHQLSGIRLPFILAIAIVTFAAGLFVLLGGLGFRRILFVVIGAYCGGAFIISGKCPNLLLAIASVGICAVLAVFLQDAFLVLIVSLFAAVYGYLTLISPYVNTSGELVSVMRDLTIGVPFYNWPILLALVAAPVAAKATWFQGTSAALSAIAGTLMLFAAGFMLYFHSSIAPKTNLYVNNEIILAIFVGLAVLGTCLQMFVLPRLSKRIADSKEFAKMRAKRSKKNKPGETGPPVPKTTTWRTA
jgi:hypothetical protein